ncbi:MAG: hypothetical protein H6623_01435 [Bdellovibrionaceae bacterium]|nr:hypothetical protein [Pseudobdellovibrionaceae bacterium]
MNKQSLFFIIISFLTLNTFAASTPDYYKCNYKEGGEWNYGRAPNVCAASPFGPDSTVYASYPHLIFSDSASRTAERTRFITELSAAIRDASEYYLKKRKPGVSSAELGQWKFAIQLVAAHESRLSHYRKTTDSRLKMMRGDVGHGHGLMQIDDRSHFNPISTGIAWNLITNLTYAMDIFYTQWERAASQSCVGGASNWKNRIRAAWAAYNGGPGSICRWTNSGSAWAQNDKNFLDMYNGQSWKTYVSNSALPSSIDASCLIEQKENCAAPGNDTSFVENNLYQLPDKSTCAYIAGKLHCVTENRDAICLRSLGNVKVGSATAISDSGGKAIVKYDRHSLCAKYDSTLIAIGASIKLQKNINLRSTPGGTLLVTVPSGQTLQISDFELRNSPTNDRYYQVTYNNKKGYLYAGNDSDHSTWAAQVATPTGSTSSLAQVGESISIVNKAGINLRSAPGGSLIKLVPVKTTLKVLDSIISGTNNDVYYKVVYGSSTGYIYSGALLPSNTMSNWTQKIP